MKKFSCPKIAFRVSSETSNGFKHFYFQILKRKEFSETDMEEMAMIRFQSDTSSKGWYAMRVNVETSGNAIDHIGEALKLIKKILPDDKTPETVLAKLAELKIPRVEYDSRLSQFVTEKDCPESSLTRWMDGYNNYNADYGCTIAVLAENENDARNKITKEFGDSIAKGYSLATFEKWIAANKPVEQNVGPYMKAACFAPIEQIMVPLA